MIVANMNRSVSIQRVWAAMAGSSNDPWHETDLSQPIPPENSMTITFGSGPTCFIDVKVQFSDGVTQTFGNVNICRSDRVVAR